MEHLEDVLSCSVKYSKHDIHLVNTAIKIELAQQPVLF